MDKIVRRTLTFECEGTTLSATLDSANSHAGLLIVSGGNEIRIGAHRGMAKLAADIAAAGHPVFRFDRRGIGDSHGENEGFTSSGPDIIAATAAFSAACPQLKAIAAFGNCDAAAALTLFHARSLNALVLANVWIIETADDLPPPAAIRAHYAERLRDPKAWKRLLAGTVNIKMLGRGLRGLARPNVTSSLAQTIVTGIRTFPGSVEIILAERDMTAIAFADEWRKVGSAPNVAVTTINSASHSFASARDYAVLLTTLLATLKRL
jgi:exosortase A-associated hydrolase 1